MSKDGVCRNIVFGSPVRCQTKVHNCKYSYLLWYFIVLLSKNLLLIEFCFINSLIFLIFSPCPKYTSLGVRLSNDSWNDFRHARKLQTIREMCFAKRGNAKPFGKRLSPSAETPNLSGNDFRHARKHQTFCGMSCGRSARDINKKSTLKKWIFKVLCKRRRLPTLPHCPIWHGVPSGELRSRR